jgi:hypothetical protein
MTIELWHSCRRCRAKLTEPTGNPRSAFCCKGCWRLWYATHCPACEGPKTDRHGRECRTELAALKSHGVMGKFYQERASPTQIAKIDEACSQTPIFIGPTGQSKPTDQWRIVAGPELSETGFRLATLEPHPRIKWDMGNTASIGKTSTPLAATGFCNSNQSQRLGPSALTWRTLTDSPVVPPSASGLILKPVAQGGMSCGVDTPSNSINPLPSVLV